MKRPERQTSFDVLRGFAVLIMIADHISDLFYQEKIELFSFRFFTRLSMPLFSALLGYFLIQRKSTPWKRVGQVALASLLSNYVFIPNYLRLDCLVSFLLVVLIFFICRPFFFWAALAVGLYPWDPTKTWLDYPLSVTLSYIALGAFLRKRGSRRAYLTAGVLCLSYFWIPSNCWYGVAFTLPSIALIELARRNPGFNLPVLSFLGRHPLVVYVVQWYVLAITRHYWGIRY